MGTEKKGKDAHRAGQPHALHTGDTSKESKHAKREGQGKGATVKRKSRAGSENHNARHNCGMREDSQGEGESVKWREASIPPFLLVPLVWTPQADFSLH